MTDVVIVDYGLCNLDSVRRGFEEVGASVEVSADPRDLEHADRIVLPGVGSFSDAMANLRAAHLDEAMTQQVLGKEIPFLGICLGMQLIASLGTEGGETSGLGWIDARVERLAPTELDRRIPHVGWNEVNPSPVGDQLFAGIPSGSDFYFVHSFHFIAANPGVVAATTPYCGTFVSSVSSGLVHGVQFHPEKSQRFGLQLLKNFFQI